MNRTPSSEKVTMGIMCEVKTLLQGRFQKLSVRNLIYRKLTCEHTWAEGGLDGFLTLPLKRPKKVRGCGGGIFKKQPF